MYYVIYNVVYDNVYIILRYNNNITN